MRRQVNKYFLFLTQVIVLAAFIELILLCSRRIYLFMANIYILVK